MFVNADFLCRSENLLSTDSFLLSTTTVCLTWSLKRRYRASGRHSQNVLTTGLVWSYRFKPTVAFLMSAPCFILQMLNFMFFFLKNTPPPRPPPPLGSEPSLNLQQWEVLDDVWSSVKATHERVQWAWHKSLADLSLFLGPFWLRLIWSWTVDLAFLAGSRSPLDAFLPFISAGFRTCGDRNLMKY